MAPIRFVYVGRSDGKLSTLVTKAKKKESNGPTKEQLQRAKASNGLFSFYQELPIEDSKNIDWRKKLGGLLVREITRIKKEEGVEVETCDTTLYEFMLAAFPDNYRLFEHRRVANPDDPTSRGPNDRRDVYLYGHPQGRKKRFRSPADFLPHLLWLSIDEDADPENCSCKLCTPEDMVKAAEEMAALQRKLFGPLKRDEPPKDLAIQTKTPGKESPGQTAVVSATSKFAAAQSVRPQPQKIIKQEPVPITSNSLAPTAQLAPVKTEYAGPAPPVAPRSAEQALDARANKPIYRPGEVVWYQKNGTLDGPVGLAVITNRNILTHQGKPRSVYAVQPLSHPYGQPPQVMITDERCLKPWLAFSTPDAFHHHLRRSQLPYGSIDWQGLLDGVYGPGDVEADASMFAAKAVDISYTPFEPLPPENNGPGEIKYNGVFVGGEKIWNGEAIRLKVGSGRDIMVVSEIVEKALVPGKPIELFVCGDVYTYRTVPYDPKRQIPRNNYLPTRVLHDLDIRNRASIAEKNVVSYWKHTQPRTQLSLSEVKGRWYESYLVLPIVLGKKAMHDAIKAGDIRDVGESLNARADSSPVPVKNGNRKNTRVEAFEGSIPAGSRFGTGMSVPQNQAQGQAAFMTATTNTAAPVTAHQPQNQAKPDVPMTSNFVDQLGDSNFSQAYLGGTGAGGGF